MRRPIALANWKMEMTIGQALSFVTGLRESVQALAAQVEVILCPPYTALYPVGKALIGSEIVLGAQNVSTGVGGEYTGQVSARLLADVGCRWVVLGHWEVRRHLGDTDGIVHVKVGRCLEQGLCPMLLVGQGKSEAGNPRAIMEERLGRILEGCTPEQVAEMALMFEPETAIGSAAPLSPEQVAEGCGWLRHWIGQQYGERVAEAVRVVYGGSVSPEYAPQLLQSKEVDGLGVGRKGREVAAFAEVIRAIAAAKGLEGK